MDKHQGAITGPLKLALDPPNGFPDGHIETINALQAKATKQTLNEADLISRPILLFGNQLTAYFTRVRDEDLYAMAEQINDKGGSLLSGHVTDEIPLGRVYKADVISGSAPGELLLTTWAYWLNDTDGQNLAAKIDAGIAGQASIGYFYDRAICSITGLDYWDSPYIAGQEYEITDAETGRVTRQLCFIWTVENVEFSEASIVYEGAYPNTRVGGESLAASASPTRFVMAASRDTVNLLSKTKPKNELGKPTPPVEPERHKEVSVVKLKLKMPDGSVKELEDNEVQGVLDAQLQTASEGGEQKYKEAVAKTLGLEPKDLTDAKLAELKAQAAAGLAYRESLNARLSAAALAVEGDAPKAERIVRLAKNAELSDLEELVDDWETKRDETIPNGRLSRENDPDKKPHAANYDAV